MSEGDKQKMEESKRSSGGEQTRDLDAWSVMEGFGTPLVRLCVMEWGRAEDMMGAAQRVCGCVWVLKAFCLLVKVLYNVHAATVKIDGSQPQSIF